MNEIAAERSRDSPITSIKQNYLNLFYLFFDRPLIRQVPEEGYDTITSRFPRQSFAFDGFVNEFFPGISLELLEFIFSKVTLAMTSHVQSRVFYFPVFDATRIS